MFKNHKKISENGFSLVEMVVAIVIFGLIVAIAVPVYANQRNKGAIALLNSALTNASVNLTEARVQNNGQYPLTLPTKIVPPQDVVFDYNANGDFYCLKGVTGNNTLYVSSSSSKPSASECSSVVVDTPVASIILNGSRNSSNVPTLTWSNLGTGYTYRIYANNSLVTTVSTNTYAGNPITASTDFHVIGISASGDQTPASNTVTLAPSTPPPSGSPTLSAGTAVDGANYAKTYPLTWDSVTGAAEYRIHDGSNDALLATVPAPPHNVTIARGDTKQYYVIAANVSGASGKSNVLSLSNADWNAPTISATFKRSTPSVTTTWTQDPSYWGVTSVTIQYSSDVNFGTILETVTPPQANRNHTFTGNMTSSSIYVRMRVQPASGSVLTSNVVTLSTAGMCSDANATTAAGWNPAAVNSVSGKEAELHNAAKIWSKAGDDIPGTNHFRKQFYLPATTTVAFTAYGDDSGFVYLNGTQILNPVGFTTPKTSTQTIGTGCHTLVAVVQNGKYETLNNKAGIQLSAVNTADNSVVTVTDTTWKAYTTSIRHFSDPSYYAHSWGISETYYESGNTAAPTGPGPSNWTTATTGTSPWMVATGVGSTYNTPQNTRTYYRNPLPFSTRGVSVIFYLACDNQAEIYLNGTLRGTCTSATTPINFTFTPPAGQQTNVGINLLNGGTATNPTGILFSARLASNNTVVMESGGSGVGNWTTTAPTTQSTMTSYSSSITSIPVSVDY